jgi:hypothetical protein
MRILFLQQQPCVRALKYAVGLRSASPRIRLGFAYQGKTLSEWYGSGDELFERWWDLGSEPITGLRAAGEEFRPDLIHSHNLPDSLTVIALELSIARRRRGCGPAITSRRRLAGGLGTVTKPAHAGPGRLRGDRRSRQAQGGRPRHAQPSRQTSRSSLRRSSTAVREPSCARHGPRQCPAVRTESVRSPQPRR